MVPNHCQFTDDGESRRAGERDHFSPPERIIKLPVNCSITQRRCNESASHLRHFVLGDCSVPVKVEHLEGAPANVLLDVPANAGGRSPREPTGPDEPPPMTFCVEVGCENNDFSSLRNLTRRADPFFSSSHPAGAPVYFSSRRLLN